MLDCELREDWFGVITPDPRAPRVRLDADPSIDGTHAALYASKPGGTGSVWLARPMNTHGSSWGPTLRTVHDCSGRDQQLELGAA